MEDAGDAALEAVGAGGDYVNLQNIVLADDNIEFIREFSLTWGLRRCTSGRRRSSPTTRREHSKVISETLETKLFAFRCCKERIRTASEQRPATTI